MADALGLVLLLFLATLISLFGMMPIFGSGCRRLVFLLLGDSLRLQVFGLVLHNHLLLFYNVLLLNPHRDLAEGVHDLGNLLVRWLVKLRDSRIIWIWKFWFILDYVVADAHVWILRSNGRWWSLSRPAVFSYIGSFIPKTLVHSRRLRSTSIGLLFKPVIGTQLTVKVVLSIQFLLGCLRW